MELKNEAAPKSQFIEESSKTITEEGNLVKAKNKDAEPDSKVSWLRASYILSNIWLSCGLLYFPTAVKDAGGILNAAIILVTALFVTEVGLVMIARCSDICGMISYQDVVRAFTGRIGLFWCNVLIIISLFGICVTFLVIIADQMDLVALHAYGADYCHVWYLKRSFTMTAVAVVFILPFCFPKFIGAFWFGSFLGVLSAFYLLGLVMYKYITMQESTKYAATQDRSSSWMGVFKVVTVIMFSFDAHIPAVPIYASLEKRTLSDLGRILACCSFLALAVYMLVGAFGYLTFGQEVQADILTAYFPIDIPNMICMALIAFKCVTTYPVAFFCIRLALTDLVTPIPSCTDDADCAELIRRVMVTLVLFTATVILALLVPNIGAVISLLGGTAAFFLYIFPGLCFMKAYVDPTTVQDHLKRALGFGYVVLGTFLFATTTTQSIYRYANGELLAVAVECK